MTNWQFSIGGGHPALVQLGRAAPPTAIHLPNLVDLLLYLAAGNPLPAGQVERRLKAGAAAMRWPALYTRLKTAPHFRKYRGRKYDSYKEAALARAAGTATAEELALANGLSAEIAQSRIIVPKGQIVLHGRSDRLPSTGPVYPAFLSTTLSPFVARLSAVRRTNQLGGHPTIYIFTLTRELPAMWGHVGGSSEWELLFDADLAVHAVRSHSAVSLDIIEASLG